MAMKIQEKQNMRIAAVFLVFFSLLWVSCGQNARDSRGRLIADSAVRRGRELAAVYCQSCHALPEPSQLNKATWEKGVLPAMGPRLGIFRFGGVNYPSDIRDPSIGPAFYPSQPVLALWQWQEIIDYYSGMAPDSMPRQPGHEAIDTGLTLFRAVMPPADGRPPLTSFVRVDTVGGRRQVVTGSLFPNVVRRWSFPLRLTDSTFSRTAVVDMSFSGDSGLVCNIGNINPNNGRSGTASRWRYGADGRMLIDSTLLLGDLARPVQVIPADLNGDGRGDLLICEFGNLKGALTWMEGMEGGKYVRHVLRAQPGAIKAYVQDVNHDGLPDVWALFAQGDEGIFLYINKGGGRFEEQRVLQFPPEYGSSYFELADMNVDGFPDIIYTCGDNADYSLVLKPFHGVYVYLNDGQNHFRQAYFYPINGCYKAMARDFDGDGDLDLAVISAFADFGHHPEEGFVYLENRGGLAFKPYGLPAGEVGRWLTMDAGDIDGDGRIDLVLGNFSEGPVLSRGKVDWKKGPSILVLMNINVIASKHL